MRIIILILVSTILSGCVLGKIKKENDWYEQAHFDCFNAWGFLLFDRLKMIVTCLKTVDEKPIFVRSYFDDVK